MGTGCFGKGKGEKRSQPREKLENQMTAFVRKYVLQPESQLFELRGLSMDDAGHRLLCSAIWLERSPSQRAYNAMEAAAFTL